MKMLPSLLALALSGGVTVALADPPGLVDASAPENPYRHTLGIGMPVPNMHILIRPDELANPWEEAHAMESDHYNGLYLSYYGAIPAHIRGPVVTELPSALDAEGRPLFFDGSVGSNRLQHAVMDLFGNAKFQELDRLFEAWNNPGERRADGLWKLAIFQTALIRDFENVADQTVPLKIIRQWREQMPNSRAAALAEALYWVSYAWNARGGGYSDSVSAAGWQLFLQRLDKALAVLDSTRAFASTSPLWWRVYVTVGNNLQWPKARLLAVYVESLPVTREYTPMYTYMVDALSPRWGGSWQLVDRFIEEAVKDTSDQERLSLYARLYLSLSERQGPQFSLFRDTRADWSRMKQGFEEMLRLYPHSAWDVNVFAATACMAEDKVTYGVLRARIGNYLIPDAWPSNRSSDLCDQVLATR
jgi:hypothetical protein